VLLTAKGNELDATLQDAFSILANQLTVSYRNAMRYENMEKQSLYDELTQLPNHRFCERRLQEEIMRFDGQTSLSLLLIDLDHFKKINDTYGHLAGNVVLERLARTFESCIRKSDFVARYGGEEFIVVLPGAPSKLAREIGEKIRSTVEKLSLTVPTMEGETANVSVTVSIGVATSPDDADTAQQLVRYADRAMYHGAKRAGRNRVAVYSDDKKSKFEDERKEPLLR
jgi:diguanylate cyclase (GGDEF)-like protein